MRKTQVMLSVITAAAVVALACLSACSPSTPAPVGGAGASEPSGDTAWSLSVDCDTCHTAESGKMTTGHADMTCTSCHADMDALTAVHDGKTSASKMPNKLKKTKVLESTCVACHDTAANLADKTAGCMALTDTQGKVVNPHEVMSLGSDGHAGGVSCAKCHGEHSGVQVEKAAVDLCLSCHHEGVYECYTCHE